MADLFEWNQDFHLGVDEIDTQHEQLVALLNRLHDAIHARRGSAAVQTTLGELVAYTAEHFRDEEKLMTDAGYPAYEAHQKIHIDLVDQVVELQEKLATGQASVTFELMHFLRVWLARHICETDRAFANWLLEYRKDPSKVQTVRYDEAATAPKRWWQFWR